MKALLLLLLLASSAQAEISCPRPGDVECWRRAAIEKILACDDPQAGLLKSRIEVLRKLKISGARTERNAFGDTYMNGPKPREIVLRTDVYASRMTDRRAIVQDSVPAMPYQFASTLAILVHEMAHAAGYSYPSMSKDRGELIAQHLQVACVDTFIADVGCGFVPSCETGLRPDLGVFGRCDDAGMRESESKLEAKLANGEILPAGCRLYLTLSEALYPSEEQQLKALSFLGDVKKKFGFR